MPTRDGKLTPAEQAQLASLSWNINHAGPKGRSALARAIKTAMDENEKFAPHLKPFLEQMKDVQLDDAPPPKPGEGDDKTPLTMKALDDVLTEREGKRRLDAEKERQKAARQKMIDDGRFTAESIKGLDEFIERNGYQALDIEHAAILYSHENPPEPRGVIGQGDRIWELPRDKELLANPRKAGLKRAMKVVDEMRRRA